MLSQTYQEKTQYLTLVPGNDTKNLIGPQAHGGVVFQGRSRRDWFELLALNFLRMLSRSNSRFKLNS